MNRNKKEAFDVSIVIPIYNGERFLEKTLNSIVNQTCAFKELILVDDNSSDNSLRIIYEFFNNRFNNKLDFDLKIIKHKTNHGAAYSYTHGAFLAESKYIIFFDQDDIALENMVETLYKTIKNKNQKDKKCVIVIGGVIQIDEKGSVIDDKPVVGENFSPDEFVARLLVRNRGCRTGGMIIDLKVFKELGGFDSEIKSAMDWDFCIRAAQSGYYAYFLDKPLLKYRRHSDNITSTIEIGKRDAEIIYKRMGLDRIKNIIKERIKNKCDALLNCMMLFSFFKTYKERFKEVCLEAKEICSECYNNEDFLFMLSVCALEDKEIETAEKLLRSVLDINHKNAAALNNMGCIEVMKGNLDEAEKLFRMALKIRPHYLDARKNLDILARGSSYKDFETYYFTMRPLRQALTSYLKKNKS